MIYRANDLKGLFLQASDGEIGKCVDFLFDDEHWAVRYMDARAGNWWTGRRVLISPISLEAPDWENQRLSVNAVAGSDATARGDADATARGDGVSTVAGFLVDIDTWVLRYVVVDSGKWLAHDRCVVPLAWIEDISWEVRSVYR